jgi:hypothetical protein
MLVTIFSLFLLAACVVGLFIWMGGRYVNDHAGKAVAENKFDSLHKAIDEAEDANKTREAISRDYATGKPRRMQGKYDID